MSSESTHETFPPGPPSVSTALPLMPGEREDIAKKLDRLRLPSLVSNFQQILSDSGVQFRNNIEVDPRTLPDVSIRKPIVPDDTAGKAHLWKYATSGNWDGSKDSESLGSAVIGGAIVRNISLLLGVGGHEDIQFGELPVLPLQVNESERAKLYSSVSPGEGVKPLSILVLPEEYTMPPGYEHAEECPARESSHIASLPDSEGAAEVGDMGLEMAELDMYTISGDIVDFWGVPGLTAKLYKYKGVSDGEANTRTDDKKHKEKEPAREKVKLNAQSLVFQDNSLGALFPFIDLDEFRSLPISNLELTYSEDKSNNPLYRPGLRLELDIHLKDSLQWVADAIKNLFGSPEDKGFTIHLSAWLSDSRSWSEPPKIGKLVLQGYFKDMSLKPWNILEFKSLGIELTATKSSESWLFGFGFIGEVMITNIQEACLPVNLSYKISRHVGDLAPDDLVGELDVGDSEVEGKQAIRTWDLVVVARDWNKMFGLGNINMTEANFRASFREGKFNSSIKLYISGQIKVGDGEFRVHGQFAKGWLHTLTWARVERNELYEEDHFIRATIGDLNLGDIKKIHAQITDQDFAEYLDGDGIVAGDDITFKNLSIRVSYRKYSQPIPDDKVLELVGEVTVGDVTTYSASLTFASDGITIIGGVSDLNVPGTNITVEEAELKAYVGLKKKRTSQKPSAGLTGKEEKSLAKSDGGSGRESSFAVLGVVKHENATFKAGFYMAKKKDKKERDWLVFGLAEHIRLRSIWPSIAEDNFLNLQLDNVALIASSEDRGVATKRQKGEKDESKNGGKGEPKHAAERHTDGGLSTCDVVSTIHAYNYPIIKGFQVCATVSSFEQLEQLNHGRRIEGLMLSLGVSTEGQIKVAIRLPKTFRVQLSKYAYLDDFDTSIGVEDDNGPHLRLSANLTVLMEDSDPIHVKGVIIGTLSGAKGELYMDTDCRWINPFSLNKELIVSRLGIGAGFDYATVLLTGPTYFAFRGKVNIGEYSGGLDVGIDIKKAAAVLQVDMKQLDVMDIVRIAGILTQIRTLQSAAKEAEGVVVFRDIKLYLSSGAKFLGRHYERGIQVAGQVDFFGKTGEFDGRFTEEGVVIKAGLDSFNLGGLEVTSLREYNGKKRATMDVEMTKTRQSVLIDGIVRYHDIELKVLIDASLQERYLKADISIRLAASLSFQLVADVQVGDRLENSVVKFEGHIEAAVINAIGEGIIEGIKNLEAQANEAIDIAEADTRSRLREVESDLNTIKRELHRLKAESDQEVLVRRDQVDKENEFLSRTYDEIEELDNQYREAKSRRESNDSKIQELKRQQDEAKARLAGKIREMRKEYDRKIQEAKDDQAHWESEKRRHIEKKEAQWGDSIRKGQDAKESWAWWDKEETRLHAAKQEASWNLDHCDLWDKPYWSIRLADAALDLEAAKVLKRAQAELWHFAESIVRTDAFRLIEREIADAVYQVSRAASSLDSLIKQGPMGFAEAMLRDERREIDRQIELIDELLQASRKLQKELEKAKAALEETKGRLSPQQKEARKRIVDLEAEIKLKPFEHAYRTTKEDYDKLCVVAEMLISTLEDIRKGINVGADVLRQVTKLVMQGIPQIKEIRVKASSEVLVKYEPLLFEITVTWLGQDHTCHVEWAPNQDAQALYGNAAKNIVAIADE